MKESKDPFDRMILDDLEREADEIRRNVAAANLPPMTNEQKERIRENIQKEIDAREVQKICEQLPKEYQEALKIGMETIEKEKKSIRRTGNPPDLGLHPPGRRRLRAGGRTAPSDG